MKMFCNVVDAGNTYLVENAFVNQTNHINFTTSNRIIDIDDTAVYDSILYNLTKGNIVRIPKNVDPLTPSDLIIKKMSDKLGIEKATAISDIKNTANKRIGNVSNYDFFEYNILNNKLVSKGYNITGDTKEDQYLDILSKGDNDLINLLQKFLEVQSKIEENESLYQDCNKAIMDIEGAVDIANVTQIKNKFLSKYY